MSPTNRSPRAPRAFADLREADSHTAFAAAFAAELRTPTAHRARVAEVVEGVLAEALVFDVRQLRRNASSPEWVKQLLAAVTKRVGGLQSESYAQTFKQWLFNAGLMAVDGVWRGRELRVLPAQLRPRPRPS